MLGGADSSPVITYVVDGIMYVVSLGLFPVLSMLLIYYLARGRQFVWAYALSMLSFANHILIVIKFHDLCMHYIIFQIQNNALLEHFEEKSQKDNGFDR